MKEREKLEGRCEAMMEEEPPLTSPDGSRKRNSPERCPRPLYTQDSAQEDPGIDAVGADLNIVIVEVTGGEALYKKEEEEIPIAAGPGESGNPNNMSRCWKPSTAAAEEEEEETEDDEDYSPESGNAVFKSEMDDKTGVTIKEEEVRGISPAGCQETLHGFRTWSDAKPRDMSANQRAGRGGTLAAGPEMLSSEHQTVEEDKPFSCGECGGLFKHKSSLVLHRRIHSGEKPFSCSQCGRRFTQKANFVRHQRRHTGEKPYKCGDCGKQYAQKQSLLMHQKFHAENEPYSCPECSASFIRQSHLVNHRKAHKELRRYVCPACGDFFMLRSSLIIHQRVHSAEKRYSSSAAGQ